MLHFVNHSVVFFLNNVYLININISGCLIALFFTSGKVLFAYLALFLFTHTWLLFTKHKYVNIDNNVTFINTALFLLV